MSGGEPQSQPQPQPQPIYRLVQGRSPLIISVPHVGTALPPHIEARMTAAARALPDTDWHVDRLYDFAVAGGASLLAAQYSRYVVDLNRPPDDSRLYSGQVHTGLCPLHSFAGEPLYRDAADALPAEELQLRRERFWQPYHAALAATIAATRERHGHALLLDAHSIRSRVPRLFAGRLPDLNLGTDDGRACEPQRVQPLLQILAAQRRFSSVLNGRFKGGYITRHYGAPAQGVHALQIELAQASYMDESGCAYEEAHAVELKRLLEQLLGALLGQAPAATATP